MTDRQKTRPRPNPRRAFAPSYGTILEEGVRRRTVLKGFIAAMGAAAFAPALEATRAEAAESTLTFTELKRVRDTADHWPDDYERQILVRWGDALFADSPEFDVAKLNGKAAERQFGYNNDFTQFLPLPWGEKSSDHGLMVVQATKPAILANCRPLSLHVLK